MVVFPLPAYLEAESQRVYPSETRFKAPPKSGYVQSDPVGQDLTSILQDASEETVSSHELSDFQVSKQR